MSVVLVEHLGNASVGKEATRPALFVAWGGGEQTLALLPTTWFGPPPPFLSPFPSLGLCRSGLWLARRCFENYHHYGLTSLPRFCFSLYVGQDKISRLIIYKLKKSFYFPLIKIILYTHIYIYIEVYIFYLTMKRLTRTCSLYVRTPPGGFFF